MSTSDQEKPHWGVDTNAMVTETTPRWTAVDEFARPKLFPPTRQYHAATEHALTNSLEKGLQDISVAPSQGKFLHVQCQLIRAKHILEVGTLGAYSTIWMATATPETRVISLEIDPKAAAIARENIAYAGLSDRVEVREGAALDLLPKIAAEVKSGALPKFDFTFIDADKDNAWPYFDYAVKLSHSGSAVYLDNMVRKGLLAAEDLVATDVNVAGIRKAVENIGNDKRVDGVLLQTVSEKNYDGFLLAVVK